MLLAEVLGVLTDLTAVGLQSGLRGTRGPWRPRRTARCLLAGCIGLFAIGISTAAYAIDFERLTVEASFPVEEVLVGRFADAPTLVLVGGDDGMMFSVHTLATDGWREAHRAVFPDGTVLIDRMSVADRDRLATFDGERLALLEPSDWSFRTLDMPPLSTLYRVAPRSVALADIGRDVNGDGRDDLALPDFDGLWIALQEESGGFGKPFKLPVPPSSTNGASEVSFRVPQTYPLDYDGDGRGDLAVVRDGGLIVFRDARDETDPMVVVPGGLAETSEPIRTLRKLADLNGDGIADLAIEMRDEAAAFYFHFGRREGTATVFDDDPTSTIPAKLTDMMVPVPMTDIDGDGRLDFLVSSMGGGSIARMALTWRMPPLDLAIHLMDADGFDGQPNAKRKIKQSVTPAFADLNGDGRPDLVQVVEGGLEILLGEDSARLFARRALEVDAGADDKAASSVAGADIDQDGREDLILRYAGEAATLVLLSR